MPAILALAAHPDDIEFYFAGTLLQLGVAGWDLHYCNLSSGNLGSATLSAQETRRIRSAESKEAAALLGATWHEPFCDDLEILYDVATLRRAAGVIRLVQPRILLTHSPQDYMEDHTNTCRIAVTAAFARGMPNFWTEPGHPHVEHDVAVYHAMPHGLVTPMREPIQPDLFVDTTSVQAQKRAALACHRSQKEWLDASQGMDSYLATMDELSREVGRRSGCFEHAEGWRRRLHLGFSSTEKDPLAEALGSLAIAAK
ncbi:MAG TPA: PIG-L family deacetylase [Verrucomicrobiota bacterium]|nr:LmbE family protein [Verrucomicrobiales bacterium]HRI16335.1 PIG-L family deacetylase [Verrucomicrobiota bacterium]